MYTTLTVDDIRFRKTNSPDNPECFRKFCNYIYHLHRVLPFEEIERRTTVDGEEVNIPSRNVSAFYDGLRAGQIVRCCHTYRQSNIISLSEIFFGKSCEIPADLSLCAKSTVCSGDCGVNSSYSPFGSTSLDSCPMVQGLDSVRAVKCWEADFLELGVNVDANLPKEILTQIEQAYTHLDAFNSPGTDLWENMVEEYEGRVSGGGWGTFSFNADELLAFLKDAEKAAALVRQLDPTGSLWLDGCIESCDPDHPCDVIHVIADKDHHWHIESSQIEP